MTTRPVIIDCDPGQDDAVAILLALAAPEALDVRAVTTVAGNVPLALTAANALRVVELAGRTEVPVHAGCPRPMLRPLVTAEHVHGSTGLDGCDLPPPEMPLQDRHAVEAIVRLCLDAGPDGITLCPIGPLTNIALAIVMEPRILPCIREIVLMGGAARVPGNVTPSAEFNIHVDPHAAHVVFECGRPIVMLGLDVTHKAITTPQRLDAIRAIGTPVSDAVAGMLAYSDTRDLERYGEPGGPLHDPCVVAYLLKPELFSGRRARVRIETASELTMGRTVVDWRGAVGEEPNAFVVGDIDADGFYALLTDRLGSL